MKPAKPLQPKSLATLVHLRRYSLRIACFFFLLMVAVGSIPGKAEALSAATHDKLLHFVAYSVLSVLLYLGIPGSRWRRALGTLAGVAFLGLLDETIQHFLHYRNSDVRDWLFNMLAAALSVIACSVLHPLIGPRYPSSSLSYRARRNNTRTN